MAKYKLIVTSKTIIEIQDAIDYYNNRKEGLGKGFLTNWKFSLPPSQRIRNIALSGIIISEWRVSANSHMPFIMKFSKRK